MFSFFKKKKKKGTISEKEKKLTPLSHFLVQFLFSNDKKKGKTLTLLLQVTDMKYAQ